MDLSKEARRASCDYRQAERRHGKKRLDMVQRRGCYSQGNGVLSRNTKSHKDPRRLKPRRRDTHVGHEAPEDG